MSRPTISLAHLTTPAARVILSAQAAVAAEELYQRSVVEAAFPETGASPSTVPLEALVIACL